MAKQPVGQHMVKQFDQQLDHMNRRSRAAKNGLSAFR